MTWNRILPTRTVITAWHNEDGTITLSLNTGSVQLNEEERRSLAEYLLEGLDG